MNFGVVAVLQTLHPPNCHPVTGVASRVGVAPAGKLPAPLVVPEPTVVIVTVYCVGGGGTYGVPGPSGTQPADPGTRIGSAIARRLFQRM